MGNKTPTNDGKRIAAATDEFAIRNRDESQEAVFRVSRRSKTLG
jgi:hypothetical protein